MPVAGCASMFDSASMTILAGETILGSSPEGCMARREPASMFGTPSSAILGASIDPEDCTTSLSTTRVRWDNPLVADTYELPPVKEADRKLLFFSREEEMANRAHIVLEATIIRCVAAVALWCMACFVLATCVRCLMFSQCQVLT